jgi:hypothetical protein
LKGEKTGCVDSMNPFVASYFFRCACRIPALITNRLILEKQGQATKNQNSGRQTLQNNFFLYFCTVFNEKTKGLTRGVTGNTSDFGSEESRFEPWRVNQNEGAHNRVLLFYSSRFKNGNFLCVLCSSCCSLHEARQNYQFTRYPGCNTFKITDTIIDWGLTKNGATFSDRPV